MTVNNDNVCVGAGLTNGMGGPMPGGGSGGGTGNSSTWIESESNSIIKGDAMTFYLESNADPFPIFPSIEWDFNYPMMGPFQADESGSDWFATTTFTTSGTKTLAARVTDNIGNAQILTLSVMVSNPPPVVIVPDGFTATSGTPATIPVSATSDSGIASAEWWFSYEGEDYVLEGALHDVSPTYSFELAGEYDAWVVVTANDGQSSEDGFHISVNDGTPVAQVQITTLSGGSVANGIDEGSSVAFTVNDLSLDDLDTTTVYVDWTGNGVYDQLNEAGVDFIIDQSNPDKVSFSRLYDQDSGADVFHPKIRLEDEFGIYDYDPLDLKVNNVTPTAAVTAGTQIASMATSGQVVWAIKPGQDLDIVATDPSKEDTAKLVYHWNVTNLTTGVTIPTPPATPENPGGSAFFSLPSYQAGIMYSVEGWVSDDRTESPHTVFTVVVDDPQGYHRAVGTHWLPNKIYGTFSIDGAEPPGVYNRYAQDILINFDGPVHPREANWGHLQDITVHFELDPASLQYAQSLGATIDYRFTASVFDVEAFTIWDDNFDLKPDECRFYHGPDNTVTIPGFLDDRQIYVCGSADLLVNGQVVQTTSAADFVRNANSNFNLGSLLHQPMAILATPKTLTTAQQAEDIWRALRELSQQFGDRAQKLIDTVVYNPSAPERFRGLASVIGILKGGFVGAVEKVGEDLPKNLGSKLIAWLGVDLSKFQGADWSTDKIPETLGNFLLQYSQLTWDHVYDVVRQQLGEGNLAALDQVAQWFVANGGTDIDPTSAGSMRQFLTRIQEQVPEFDLSVTSLTDSILKELTERVPTALSRAGAQMAAKFVPGVGALLSIYDGLKWFLDNKTDLIEVFNKFLFAIDDMADPAFSDAAATTKVRDWLVQGFEAAAVPLLNLGASQLGFGRLKTEIQKAISFVPAQVDKAIRRAVDAVAAKVLAAPGIAAVAGGTRPGSDSLFNGILAPAKEFQYPVVGGKTYALWAAQDKVGVKAFVAEKTANGYKLVTELTAKSFTTSITPGLDGQTAVAHISTFLTKARELHQASKTKPQAPANPNALPDLRTKQLAVATAETVVMQDILANACLALSAGCFAAGTKLWTPDGFRAVESIEAGELVYSRSEHDPAGPIEAKLVEEVFERFAGILHLHAGGRVIRTTSEHPFYVHDRGWLAVKDLHPGDWILSASGDWIAVEEVYDTGDWELVYNLRVADWHTYFVGDADWGWSAWAHNAYTLIETYTTGRMFQFTDGAYSAVWFVPKSFLKGPNPNQQAKDAVARDEQTGFGNSLQAKVNALRTAWNGLIRNDRYGTANAAATIQNLLNNVNNLRIASGGAAINLDDYDNPTLPDPPTTPNPQPGLAAAWIAFKTQRAIVRGQVLHNQVGGWIQLSQPSASYHTTGPDVDEHSGLQVWYEIYPVDGDNRKLHATRPNMSGAPWREVTYDNGR